MGIYARCTCDCGVTKLVRLDKLRDGTTKSCGCLARELAEAARKPKRVPTPKQKASPDARRLRSVHGAMMQRCYNPNDSSYADYGGRGVRVDPEWHSKEAFIAWATTTSPAYHKGLWLERMDNNGHYTPSNCAFVSPKQQGRNRRNTLYVVSGSVDRVKLVRLAEVRGMTYTQAYALYQRIKRTGVTPHVSHFPPKIPR